MLKPSTIAGLAALALCLPLTATPTVPARAGGPEQVAPVTDPLVRKECGECHMAFQPGLLPAGSWTKIMATLDDHFGDKATLPPDQVRAITAVLTAGAGRHGDPQLLRITDQGWWRHEHRLKPQEWARPEVKAKSNCAACHHDAERGSYDDD